MQNFMFPIWCQIYHDPINYWLLQKYLFFGKIKIRSRYLNFSGQILTIAETHFFFCLFFQLFILINLNGLVSGTQTLKLSPTSCYDSFLYPIVRSSHPKVFLVKGVLKICFKFTGEHPCRSVISIKMFPITL